MKNIKLFISDFNGTIVQFGNDFVKFKVKDIIGFKLLKKAGIKVAIITSDDEDLIKNFSSKLKIDYLITNSWNKLESTKELCKSLNFKLEEIAYIGDDINDIETLREVGLKACPYDSSEDVKLIPDIIILNNCGGNGAIKEFVDYIIT